MKYKHIVFDVDGTLLDTAECILYSLQQALKTITGSSPELDELTFVLGHTSVANMEYLGITDKAEETIALWVANEDKYSDMMRPFDGIPELLETLKSAGCQLGIVTSRTHEELDLVLDPHPIRSYFLHKPYFRRRQFYQHFFFHRLLLSVVSFLFPGFFRKKS